MVKLAVALALAGGVSRVDPHGSHIRGESHLLLVGDPGTGKSQFLKYAAKIVPRSVLTTGIGSSTAGLTVSAIRDGPQWMLEAGALVLSDGGVCCIDEFAGIREQDRCAIHEAMEQQSISVAKAGLVCKLNTRTTVLAATNPKLGRYDKESSISLNIGLASPLLSRFDVVLVLRDTNNASWDSVVADYLLKDKSTGSSCRTWSMEQMQTYFSVIRDINPTLSPQADQVLKAYYRRHRNSSTRNAARTTIRLLESLIRLSEAHARLMFRDVVTIQDAVTAVTVMESSMEGGALLPTGNILHSCFPRDPEREYRKHCRLVLKLLELDSLEGREESKSSTQQTSSQHLDCSTQQSSKLYDSSTQDILDLLRPNKTPEVVASQPSTTDPHHFALPLAAAPKRRKTQTADQSVHQNHTEEPSTSSLSSTQNSSLSNFMLSGIELKDSGGDDGIDWDSLIDDAVADDDDEFCTPVNTISPNRPSLPPKLPKRASVEEALSGGVFSLEGVDFDL